MKKWLSVMLALVLMMILSVSAFAEISPNAPVKDPNQNDSPSSPPTGCSVVLLVSAAATSLASAGFAVKKLTEKN